MKTLYELGPVAIQLAVKTPQVLNIRVDFNRMSKKN